jgi:type IV secretory pathway TraG/TraD family ATPase VirD4
VIDEFSAVAARQVARLFGRARSAGISLILTTQELADLQSTGEEALREKVLANHKRLREITHHPPPTNSDRLAARA